ncbi:MAG: DUF4055 domain-containing protein [bacterium]|nr:DUF4055 domain-containing protein [bacterium]
MFDSVDTKCQAYLRMEEHWPLIDDLTGGTAAMRENSDLWLPREEAEEVAAYDQRLGRSFLFGAYADTVDKIKSRPFSKPVSLTGAESLHEQLVGIERDADRQGRSLTEFLKMCFEVGGNYGLVHVLVDYPAGGMGISLAEQRERDVRPYFVMVSPKDLIGWRKAGNSVSRVRIQGTRTVEQGEYGDTEQTYIRQIEFGENGGEWAVYVKGDEQHWAVAEEGQHTFQGAPFLTLYFNRKGFLEARPPLQQLADMNLAHWQSDSQQRNILHYARVGTIFMSGCTEEEIEHPITIGPRQFLRSTNENAKAGYVEHSGKAIGSGAEDLDKLERRMEVLGMQPFVQRTGVETATGRVRDAALSDSNVEAWVRMTETWAKELYEVAAQHVGTTLPEDFGVNIFSEFGLSTRPADDMKLLDAARLRGDLSRETWLVEAKRRGLFDERFSVEDEIDRIGTEGPELPDLPDDAEEVEAA